MTESGAHCFLIRYFGHKWSVYGENREEKIDKWKKRIKMEIDEAGAHRPQERSACG